MKVSYNRIEYLESEIEVDEIVLYENFDGDLISYIRFYEDQSEDSYEKIQRVGVFDIGIELL
ncbi:hypothetical protein [Anaerococcus sp. Marseille-Q7828]|uniref:hypothetical protein n=1 Tax=Anaerococcus sp. Marseille-Q7828 TaxID=3036300 RepID=UPI0024AE3ECE|nr:hypothetical protein [Anaerococcus sp. Marseille-Q7828]